MSLSSDASEMSKRLDETFRTVVIAVPILFAFLRASGIPPVQGLYWRTDLTLTLLVIVSVALWGIGHIWGRYGEGFKLTAWLLWTDVATLLLIIVSWGLFAQKEMLSSISNLSGFVLAFATFSTWIAVTRIYEKFRQTIFYVILICGIILAFNLPYSVYS